MEEFEASEAARLPRSWVEWMRQSWAGDERSIGELQAELVASDVAVVELVVVAAAAVVVEAVVPADVVECAGVECAG